MTIEQLISSPEAYEIFVLAWAVNWLLKRLSRGRPWRKDPGFKLLLSMLPVLLGAGVGALLFDAPQVEAALAGAGAAAPASVSYSTLKQLEGQPWLPAPVKKVVAILLEREPPSTDKPEVPE